MANVKKGPQGAITTAAHKARRIARESARQAAYAVTAGTRKALRKRGALNRINRRIEAANGNTALLARLQAIRIKVAAAAGAR